jgi:hypothetical protein
MVEVKSRPQTHFYVATKVVVGKKIPWTVMSVPVRVRPAVLTFLTIKTMNYIKKFFQFTETISGTTYFFRNLLVGILSYLTGVGMGIALVQDSVPILLVSSVVFVFVYWFGMTTVYKRFNALTPKWANISTVSLLSVQLVTTFTPEPYSYIPTILLVIVAIFLIFSNSNLENHKG